MLDAKGITVVDVHAVAVVPHNCEFRAFCRLLVWKFFCEGDVDELRREFEVHHFDGEMLPFWVMDRYSSVLAAGYKEIA